MPTPSIVATGSTTPANAGRIAKLYVSGETITFTDPANPSPSAELWELISAPPGQTSVVLNPTTSTPTLVLDADPGTFRVRHTADGDVGELLIAVLATNGERIPGYRERDLQDAGTNEATWNEAGNTQGYFPAMHSAIEAIGGAAPSSVVSSTVLIADATTLSVTGLDGDLHGTYEIEGDLIIDPAAINISAEPNGLTANLFSVEALLDVAKAHRAGEWRLLTQGAAVGTYHHLRFKMTLWAARTKNAVSRNRSYILNGEEGFDFNATVHNNTFQSAGTMENTTANLISLDFVSSVASGIKIGSEVIVRKIS